MTFTTRRRRLLLLPAIVALLASMFAAPATAAKPSPGKDGAVFFAADGLRQDIVVRYKASERGAAAVLNPRYVVKCTG